VDSQYLTITEVAIALELDVDTAYELVRSGDIPGVWHPETREWTIPIADLKTWQSNDRPPS
jgi:excisionase family DNA binding protein